MIGVYAGTFIFLTGAVITLFVNRNVKVPMNGDFWDMPLRIKACILLMFFGVFILCASVMYMLMTNPGIFLRRIN